MKRLMAMLLVVCLCWMAMSVPAMARAEESSGFPFDLTITEAANHSASTWYDNGISRATLTFMLTLDYLLATNEQAEDYDFGESYVGIDDDFLFVTIYKQTTSQTLYMMYIPGFATGYAFFFDSAESESIRKLVIEGILEETCEEWAFNDPADIFTVANLFSTFLKDSK